MSTASAIRPIEVMKQHIVALDAAMLVSVTAPEVAAVHKLRTSTRRVEAHLALLEILSVSPRAMPLPDHHRESKAVRQRLQAVRRAAGAVRDLDVQRETILGDAPVAAEVHKGSHGDQVRREAKALRKEMKPEREKEAVRLIATLTEEKEKLAARLCELETALLPALKTNVAAGTLMEHVESWFARQIAAHCLRATKRAKKGRGGNESLRDNLRVAVAALDENALHDLRKSAKLCRYMGESAPASVKLKQVASSFEAIQEAGGLWHDWLLLEQRALKLHGKHAVLTQRYRRHRDAALAEYQFQLVDLLPKVISNAMVFGQ